MGDLSATPTYVHNNPRCRVHSALFLPCHNTKLLDRTSYEVSRRIKQSLAMRKPIIAINLPPKIGCRRAPHRRNRGKTTTGSSSICASPPRGQSCRVLLAQRPCQTSTSLP